MKREIIGKFFKTLQADYINLYMYFVISVSNKIWLIQCPPIHIAYMKLYRGQQIDLPRLQRKNVIFEGAC